MKKTKILIVLGTRPEAIKLAPLVCEAKKRGDFEVRVCNTGQHREMTTKVLDLFGIVPDVDLHIMQPKQTLVDVTCSVLTRLTAELLNYQPDWLVVQGDTATTFAASLAAFYSKTRVVHVEAGLRTDNLYSPWPEEGNRRLVSELAELHFPPTKLAAKNLQREGIDPERIFVTGNTGIDSLKYLVRKINQDPSLSRLAAKALMRCGVPVSERGIVLITGHRRESFGRGFESICKAINSLAERFPDRNFIYPVHPNPNVRETVFRLLGPDLENVYLIDPLEYLPFVALMARSELILTDSGGVQEEAPSLGKRVIVLRDVTERLEGLDSGFVRMAGTDAEKIVCAATEALTGLWLAPSTGDDVYGDGRACERIANTLLAYDTDSRP